MQQRIYNIIDSAVKVCGAFFRRNMLQLDKFIQYDRCLTSSLSFNRQLHTLPMIELWKLVNISITWQIYGQEYSVCF